MTTRKTVVSLVAALVVVSVLTPAVAWTAGAQEGGEEASGLVVESLDSPEMVTPDSSLTVTATVSNPTDEEVTEDVAFRLAGNDQDIVIYQSVTVEANGTETVSMTYDTAGFDTGDYVHGVTTANSSMFSTLDVTNEAEVSFAAQESDGTEVVVDSVFVPEGGYVAIHDATLLEGDAVGSVVGVSEYLEPGYHENVTVTLYEDVPGANFSQTGLTESQLLIAMPHMETSGAVTDNATDGAGDDAVGNETDANETDAADDDTVGNETDTDDGVLGNETDGNETDTADGALGNETDANETDTVGEDETTDQASSGMTYDFVSSNGTEDGPYTEDGEAITASAPITLVGDATDGTADGDETGDGVGNETDTDDGVDNETDTGDAVGNETDGNETAAGDDGTDGSETVGNETDGNETTGTDTSGDGSPLLGPLWKN